MKRRLLLAALGLLLSPVANPVPADQAESQFSTQSVSGAKHLEMSSCGRSSLIHATNRRGVQLDMELSGDQAVRSVSKGKVTLYTTVAASRLVKLTPKAAAKGWTRY